ncbi:YfcC family protein [Hymenobacter cheonanensis]|uniref:YfcC family protein n=1 Tax=Hymenobacter sp. CA2-7 TaxID=3063993 RepID=UPI002713C9A1|nr:AbgT family transporter [Hymenobacter sp. CA2-7]MDO7887075.1 AbgT family transporter [Hymenobacter sp. CA2-7]
MKSFRFPHPLVLLTLFIILAAALSYVLPAGQFARRLNAATGREVVVAGSYHRLPRTPVAPLQVAVAVPKGLADAGAVVFLIFLAGGAFTVVDQTGALRYGVDWLLRHAQGREVAIIPLVSLLFATMGALENMGEEVIALVPVLLVLMRRLGYPVLTAVAASLGAAIVGAAFSPINPFQVGIAQKLAQLPLLSAAGYRLWFLAIALLIWMAGTMRHAIRHRAAPAADTQDAAPGAAGAGRHGLVLLLLLGAFSFFAYGVVRLEWDFEQMSALFLVLGVGAGLVGGLGPTGTAEGFVAGFRDIAFSAILIGFARAIFVVLEQGHIVDTIVQGLATPLAHLPVAAAALGMLGVHAALHLPVPSVSGQAVLTMPLLVPLSDLIGLPRQVTVLAYQYGAGMTDLLTPTNGALMAMLAACGVRYDQWLRFAAPLYGLLLALGAASVLLGIWLRLP